MSQKYSQNMIQFLLNTAVSGKLKTRLIWFFHKWAERRLRNSGLLEFLESRPSGAFAPNFSDLWFLYQTAQRRNPSCVLEFGSGCSTVVIAKALSENTGKSSGTSGVLYSIDVVESWANVTLESMPEELKGLYEISSTPAVESDFEGFPVWRHKELPDIVPDLIYLDGPPLSDERPAAADILDLEERLKPGCYLIVDGRIENVKFLREHFKREWKFKHRWFFRNSVFELVA